MLAHYDKIISHLLKKIKFLANPSDYHNTILSRVRLPIPPRGHGVNQDNTCFSGLGFKSQQNKTKTRSAFTADCGHFCVGPTLSAMS